MARSIFSTRPRRKSLMDRYLHEPMSYGGEIWTRGEVILDLKRSGYDDRCIDRYLQGAELRQALEAKRRLNTPLTNMLQ